MRSHTDEKALDRRRRRAGLRDADAGRVRHHWRGERQLGFRRVRRPWLRHVRAVGQCGIVGLCDVEFGADEPGVAAVRFWIGLRVGSCRRVSVREFGQYGQFGRFGEFRRFGEFGWFGDFRGIVTVVR